MEKVTITSLYNTSNKRKPTKKEEIFKIIKILKHLIQISDNKLINKFIRKVRRHHVVNLFLPNRLVLLPSYITYGINTICNNKSGYLHLLSIIDILLFTLKLDLLTDLDLCTDLDFLTQSLHYL